MISRILAIFAPIGLILAIIMSIFEAVWILAAASAFARTAST